MRGIYPWLYVDYKENLWRFSVNENKELNYGIMYKEGKWTKENLIDSRVIGFGLFIDDSEVIHLVYSNTKGELRYCTMKEKKWVGKVLYTVEDNKYNIESIKIEIIGSKMHIFYALASEDGSDHGVLMHCIWDGHNTSINKIEDIILKSNLKEYYLININNKSEIYLFYLSDEGDEVSLNNSIYQNNKWIPSNRLYGIQGEEVYFDVELDKKYIHVLNKSKENLFYSLDHVVIDSTGGFKSFRVHECKNNLNEPLIFNDGIKTCSCWIENNEIYYSIFTGTKWEPAIKYNRDNKIKIERCNAYISEVKEGYIKERKLYATSGLDIYLYDTRDLIREENKEYASNERNISKNISNNEEVERIKAELYSTKEENKVLEDKISHLNIVIQKNQQGIERYQQQVVRALEQKRKAEENSNIFLGLQKKIQGDNEVLSEELTVFKKEKENFESMISIYIDEIHLLKEEINNITKDLIIKDRELQEETDSKRTLENQNKIISEENSLIKKELSSLIEENKRINIELELERNKSVMEKILRRRG